MVEKRCPACQKSFQLPPLSIPIILPPTGGDYDFIEGEAELRCPHCDEYLEIWIEQSLKSGRQTSTGELRFSHNPEWSVYTMLFSPNGQYLATRSSSGVRVYQNQGQSWKLIFQKEDASLVDWHMTELVISIFPESDYGDEWRYQGWDVVTSSQLWETVVDWRVAATEAANQTNQKSEGFNHSTILEVYRQKEYLDIHDLKLGQVFRCVPEDLGLLQQSRIYLNSDKNQALSMRSEAYHPCNILALWQFDLSVGSFSKIAEYTLSRSEFAWVTWEPTGTILAVELHNHQGLVHYDNMPYGLVRLDGQSLSVLQCIQQVDLIACPHDIKLRHIQLLQSGEILWCTDRIHILDAATWEYRTTLPYPFDGEEPGNRVAAAATGQWIAVSQANDVVVFDRSTDQGWSLRRQELFVQ